MQNTDKGPIMVQLKLFKSIGFHIPDLNKTFVPKVERKISYKEEYLTIVLVQVK